MFFFIRTVCLFLVLFLGLSVAMQKFFVNVVSSDERAIMPTSLTMALPSSLVRTHDTKTGLLLAGRIAQNSRDWAHARANFTALNEKFEGNATTSLRVMTLALGAGDFDQAIKTAEAINTDYLLNDAFKDDGETFDLARLLLVGKLVKEGDIDGAQALIDTLHRGALSSFAKPIMEAILTAGQKDKKITSSVKNLSSLQIIYKALSAEFSGNIDVAKSLFNRIAKKRITAQTSEMMAAFYMRHDDPIKALGVLRRARLSHPDDQEIERAIGLIEKTPDQYKEPEFAAYHLKSLPSILALTMHDFARVMLSERATDSALLFARMAGYIDDQAPGVAMTIGDIVVMQKQYDEALTAYRGVPETDADYAMAQIEIADVLYKLDRYDDAVSHLEGVLKNEKYQDANVHLALGNLYKEGGKFTKAIATYDIAEVKGREDNHGKDPEWMWLLHYFRGISFDQMGNQIEAEKDLMKALDLRPHNATVLNYLGYSYADKGENLEKAKDMIFRAVQQSPEDAYILDSMGWVLFRLEDYKGAIEYLERAAKLRPYHAVINDHLGDAYWKSGRRLEAYYMWQRAVDYTKTAQGDTKLDANEEEQSEAADKASAKLKTGLVEG